MNRKTTLAMAVLAAGILAAGAAGAAVQLRFAPVDTTLPPAVPGRLSVLVDDAVAIRTIDITVSYDTTVVRSLGGGAGLLFTTSGLQLFRGFEETAPGTWYGYCVVLGPGAYVTGPGELFAWDFEGVADGTTAVTAVTIDLSDADAVWYPEVVLPPATVTIGDPRSTVPGAPGALDLRLAPNPFNPRTTVGGALPQAAPVRLTVHDARGRLVAVLHDGLLDAGPFALAWDGRDRDGRGAPGGVYLFRLEGTGPVRAAKGLLLK